MAHNLLGPDPVRLPDDHADMAARALIADGASVQDAARAHPASSYVWAVLAEDALAGRGTTSGLPDADLLAYALARTGYHRGLDSLRKAGWRGQGPIPVDHVANQGVLRALLALAEAADLIGETDEGARCRQFLVDSGVTPDEVAALRS
ncbi:DUF3151 domain-containing protein [Luteimicrobium sp. DT211]|uniref:DUF3151 domain-containing protein n=1 Tax=Luteimicrobium sp. DT211 TaxID=3393412 RepID=UPI003CEA4029